MHYLIVSDYMARLESGIKQNLCSSILKMAWEVLLSRIPPHGVGSYQWKLTNTYSEMI